MKGSKKGGKEKMKNGVKMLMLCFNQNRANVAVFMLTSETIRLLKKN